MGSGRDRRSTISVDEFDMNLDGEQIPLQQ